MALYDSIQYLKCHKCNNPEMRLETRALVEEKTDLYYVEKYTAMVCTNCNTVVKKLDKHTTKPIVEV